MSRRRAKADATPTSSNPVFELTDMSIDFVSLVPAGANRQRKWLVRKADGTPAGVAPGDPGAPSEQSSEEQAPSPTDRPAFCPYCGAALPVGCLNCPGCDRPVPDLIDPTLPEPPAPVVPTTPEEPEEPEEPEAPKPEPPPATSPPPEGSSAPPPVPPTDEPPKPEPPKPEGEDEEEPPAVPNAEATDEDKQAAQAARSKKYEIEALAGVDASLTWPADAPTKLDLYGDPVNLKYPLGGTANEADPKRISSALSEFKQAADKYTQAGSRGKVYGRIVAAALAAGIAVTYDPNDPIDQLLPGDVKSKLEELNKAGTGAAAPAPSQGGTPPSAGSDLSGWLADMGAKAEAMLVDAKLSAALATPQPMAAAAPAPAPAPTTKAPAIEATGQQVVAKAAAELASATAQADELRLQLDAQRAEVARLAKGVGLSSSLPTGERPNVNKEQAGPSEAAARAWRGGGDLAAAVSKQ